VSWPLGRDELNALIADRELERVTPNQDGAQALLDAAARHLHSAELLVESDPEGAYVMVYDATRKTLTSLLLTQGLRPTIRGGHRVVERAINAQFTKPPPRDAFRPFRRMRQTRHQVEYEHLSAVDADLVRGDLMLARRIHQMADRSTPSRLRCGDR